MGKGETLRIGILGDREESRPSHAATEAALRHAAVALDREFMAEWIPSADMERAGTADTALARFDGLWGGPGEYRSTRGALAVIRFARERDVPYLGTCQGAQHAVVGFVRDVLGNARAAHAESSPEADPDDLAVVPMSCSFVGEDRTVSFRPGSRAAAWYGAASATERFTCRFGLNPALRAAFEAAGFQAAGTDETGEVRLLELAGCRFHVATLFQPQFASAPGAPHPLVLAFLREAAGAGRAALRNDPISCIFG